MPTPAENIDTLNAYWHEIGRYASLNEDARAQDLVGNIQQWARTLASASTAMTELTDVAKTNDNVRKTFAQAGIFNTTLTVGVGVHAIFDLALASANKSRHFWESVSIPDQIMKGARPVRLAMLDGIRKAALGGFVTSRDPSGLTSWIDSQVFAMVTIDVTLSSDPNAEVVLALLGMLENAGLPLLWAQDLTNRAGPLDKLEERTPETQWSGSSDAQVTYTRELSKGARNVRGRMQQVVAEAASATFLTTKVKTFPTGDGAPTPTVLGPPKPWYMHGEVILPALGGAIAGGVAADRARAKR